MTLIIGVVLGLVIGYLSVPVSAYLIGEKYQKSKFHVGQIAIGIYLGQMLGTGIDKIFYVLVVAIALRIGIYVYNSKLPPN